MGDEEIEALMLELDGDGEPDEERFVVWPGNASTLSFFIASRGCWLRGAFAGEFLGWNYPALEARMRILKIKGQAELLPRLESMADAARPILNKSIGDS